jgi:hypothetical protein
LKGLQVALHHLPFRQSFFSSAHVTRFCYHSLSKTIQCYPIEAYGRLTYSPNLEELQFEYNSLRNLLFEFSHFGAVFEPSLDQFFSILHIFNGYSYEV